MKDHFLPVIKPAQMVTVRELETKIRSQARIIWCACWVIVALVLALAGALIFALGAIRSVKQ